MPVPPYAFCLLNTLQARNEVAIWLGYSEDSLAGMNASKRLVIPCLLISLAAAGQFSSDTRLVVLHVSVTKGNGDLVGALNRNAFTVLENGVPQPIKVFHREDVPVSIGIIIDDSASMLPDRPRVEAAALSLVDASNPKDETFIVNFNDESFLDVRFTNDRQRMKEGLTRIDARGGTAMRDAINKSLDYMKSSATKDKRVLLVITDGNDNGSTTTLDRIVDRAAQNGIVVYAIGLFSKESRSDTAEAKRALKDLTSTTGGIAFYPKDVKDVQQLAIEIARDIRSQYTIAYSPGIQQLDGTYRKIQVKVNAPGNPKARTRTGYLAVPNPADRGAAQTTSRHK